MQNQGPTAVLVTGASTGIGRTITERLAASGYIVFAGARREADIAELGRIDNVRPIQLDVTREKDIDVALRTIERADIHLGAIVNNAGVMTSGTVDATQIDEFNLTMSVNVYGTWRVTRAFAPILKSERGRIITIGSVNGVASMTGYGVYCMSKHALEAFADALAEEMAPFGVHVSIIEPGTYASDLMRNELRRGRSNALNSEYVGAGADPREVAVAVEQALSDPTPKRRYLVTPNNTEALFTIQSHLQRLIELNERHAYSLSRDALVEMLDLALERSKAGVPFSHTWPGESGSAESERT